MKTFKLLIATLVLLAGQATAAGEQRWYSEEQVTQGQPLFLQNCASCHGPNGEATPNWKQTDANGNYPPPPLNGTAHTWHHNLDLLRRTIREGGAKLGGQMPGFEGRLSAAEIDSIIAFFQSKWPDDIYQRWAGRFLSSDQPSLTDIIDAQEASVTKLLRQRIGGTEIDDVAESSVANVWRVRLGNRYVYLLEDGKYALTGDLIDLEKGVNMTEQLRRAATLETISGFSDADLVVFRATGEPKAVLNVFTDTSCPYCQKLHNDIGELQAAGITVRYIPYARGGRSGPGYQHLRSVWCAEDRKQAMTDAKNQVYDNLPPGNCAAAALVDRGYVAGSKIGISGTPALIKSNGEKIEGYSAYQQLIPQILR